MIDYKLKIDEFKKLIVETKKQLSSDTVQTKILDTLELSLDIFEPVVNYVELLTRSRWKTTELFFNLIDTPINFSEYADENNLGLIIADSVNTNLIIKNAALRHIITAALLTPNHFNSKLFDLINKTYDIECEINDYELMRRHTDYTKKLNLLLKTLFEKDRRLFGLYNNFSNWFGFNTEMITNPNGKLDIPKGQLDALLIAEFNQIFRSNNKNLGLLNLMNLTNESFSELSKYFVKISDKRKLITGLIEKIRDYAPKGFCSNGFDISQLYI